MHGDSEGLCCGLPPIAAICWLGDQTQWDIDGYQQYFQILTHEQIKTYRQIWTDIHNIHRYKHMDQYRHINGYGQISAISTHTNV